MALSTEQKIHLVANLVTFTPPRYPSLPGPALETYLQLLTAIMNTLPVSSFNPPSSCSKEASSWVQDSDSEDEPSPHVAVVGSFEPKAPLLQLDTRTKKRLTILPDTKHINALIMASRRYPGTQISLISFILGLGAIWQGSKEKMSSTVVAHTGGGLVRELYRGWVRASPLGRDDSPSELMGKYFGIYFQVLTDVGSSSIACGCMASAALPRGPLHPTITYDG